MGSSSRAWLVVAVVLTVTAALGTQAARFEIDASADTLLTRGNELFLRSQVIQQRFSPEEFVLVAYRPTDSPLFSTESFDAIRRLSRDLLGIERVSSVRSLLNVPLPSLSNLENLRRIDSAAELTVEEAGYSPSDVAAALEDHPVYSDLLIDEDQTVAALQVLFRANEPLERLRVRITNLRLRDAEEGLDADGATQLAALEDEIAPLERELAATRVEEVEAIRRIVAEYDDAADIYVGGVHVLGYQLIDIVERDLKVFGSAVAVLVAALMLLLFRDWRWLVVAFLCCASSLVATLGLFALLDLKATVISANFAALQLILCLAMVVHLIVQYREYASDPPDTGSVLAATMKTKLAPLIYTAITTAVGFAALLASGLQPVISFGFMMIVAVAVSLTMVLSVFPAAVTLLRVPESAGESPGLKYAMIGTARAVVARPSAVLVAASVLFLVFAAGLPRLDLENSFINYFDEDTDAYRELTFIDENLGGSTPLDIVYTLPEPEEDLLIDAESFLDLQKLEALFDRHPSVGKVLSPNAFAAFARKANGGIPLTEYEITAFYRIMDEALRDSLVSSWFSRETRDVRINVRIKDTTEELDRAELLESLHADVRQVLGDDADYEFSSLFVLYQDILERLFRSQVLTLGIVFGALGLAFLAIFRSLKLALIALVPNVLVTATLFGIMGWFGIALDLMTITIAAVAMGIAVDDTIHYLHRYQAEVDGSDPGTAVKRAHSTVGFALFYTTVIICTGFASFVFSDFVPTTLFGLLTALALGSAFLFDVTVLPALLVRTDPARGRDAVSRPGDVNTRDQ